MNLEHDLKRFTGTSNYYKHITGLHYTDGIQYLANHGECYWLIDAIGSYFHITQPLSVVWILTVENNKGKLVGTNFEDQSEVITQDFTYTDFPLRNIKLLQKDGILFLPSED